MNISSSTAQGSESLEKPLCARQKAKNQYWTMELPGPSGGTGLKQAWFCHWTHCIDSGTLSEIIVCDAVPSTTAGYSSIMHRRRHMIQKHHHLLGLIKAQSTWNEAKWETDLWSDESTWMPLSPQWRREGPSSSFTVFSSKPCMVWGCVSAYEIGTTHLKGTSILGSTYRF